MITAGALALDVLRDLVAKVNDDYQFMLMRPMPEAHAEWVAIVDRANAVIYLAEQEAA